MDDVKTGNINKWIKIAASPLNFHTLIKHYLKRTNIPSSNASILELKIKLILFVYDIEGKKEN